LCGDGKIVLIVRSLTEKVRVVKRKQAYTIERERERERERTQEGRWTTLVPYSKHMTILPMVAQPRR
jgi:hypothetical protein